MFFFGWAKSQFKIAVSGFSMESRRAPVDILGLVANRMSGSSRINSERAS